MEVMFPARREDQAPRHVRQTRLVTEDRTALFVHLIRHREVAAAQLSGRQVLRQEVLVQEDIPQDQVGLQVDIPQVRADLQEDHQEVPFLARHQAAEEVHRHRDHPEVQPEDVN